MKITDVKVETIRIPMKKPFRIAFAVQDHSLNVLVKISTDEGLWGIGEAAPFEPVTGESAATVLEALKLFRTGLIGMDGKDDSLPRAAVVFALPGLMCLLNLICHGQLYGYQKRMATPPAKFRLVGRWGFPVISVLFCSGMIMESAGRQALSMPFVTPCVLGLLLMILGGHMWDCPRDAKIALRFSFTEISEPAWKAVHRFAGWLWMAVGLLMTAAAMAADGSAVTTIVLTLLALAAPMLYGYSRRNKLD